MNTPVRKFVLKDSESPAKSAAPAWIGAASWLVAPLMLIAVLGALLLLRTGPAALFTGVLVIVGALPVVWLLVSVLSPGRADRQCPDCGMLTLEPIRRDDLQGVHCKRCGYADEQASAWMFAEEGDQALEPLVIKERRGGHSAPLAGPKDRGASA